MKLVKSGYKSPTPVQAQGWPIALAGGDLIAVAKTGSGKTLGFLLPTLHAVAQAPVTTGQFAVVLTPTRELAQQIFVECKKFTNSCACVYGGAPKGEQMKQLRLVPQVVIATPGRLLDFINMKAKGLSLKNVRIVVLDEADRMLDMGFEPQMKKILGIVPTGHQTLFFTATWPRAVSKLAARYLRKDKLTHINIGGVGDLSANKMVKQLFYALDDCEKDQKLYDIFSELPDDAKIICFTNTKRRCNHLTKYFWREGFGCAAVHGDKTQAEREKALRQFRCGEWPVLFATDVAARGLDIKGITHVLNYDMPRDVDNYIHRIGRTARAGKAGTSITFWNRKYDIPCAEALAKIALEAGQNVPSWLDRYAKQSKFAKKNKAWQY